MILSHIVAASENNVIGINNTLPWHIPEDLKFFKDKTNNHIMIMGRKTFESLPGGKPLPNRLHIVITRNPGYSKPGAITVTSLNQALEESKKHTSKYGDEVFIIGGGEIFKQSLDLVNKIYLTRIYKNIDGDTFYPELNEDSFKQTEKIDKTDPLEYSFLTYLNLGTHQY